jgi:UDP-N-acetylglucosamine 2-epimerase (non-hydrolysing)
LKILHVVGARPNYMKAAPIISALGEYKDTFQQVLVHTGQHYDSQMSRVFFEDLNMPNPDDYLGVGSGTHAEQTARVMLAFEPALLKHQPDWVFVVGDVNSTLACALVCTKLGVRLAHVEAGLRSFDRTMPEEFNRLLTDQVADLLLTPSPDADANLLREGIDPEKIHLVGNVMIDTLITMLPKAKSRPILSEMELPQGGYILVTLHRPNNVDQPGSLREILAALEALSRKYPVIFPIHPRTRERMDDFELDAHGVRLIEPLRYLDFLALENGAGLVLTDSGGIQEETTYLGIPCLTVRPNTERPVTLQLGTNRLVENNRQAILDSVVATVFGKRREYKIPDLWDGKAASRIVRIMLALT